MRINTVLFDLDGTLIINELIISSFFILYIHIIQINISVKMYYHLSVRLCMIRSVRLMKARLKRINYELSSI